MRYRVTGKHPFHKENTTYKLNSEGVFLITPEGVSTFVSKQGGEVLGHWIRMGFIEEIQETE